MGVDPGDSRDVAEACGDERLVALDVGGRDADEVVGEPLATIALTTLLVNSRHVFYCLSFPLHRVQGGVRRLYSRFALIDEAYALTTTPAAQSYSSRRIIAMQLLMHSYWVAGGIAGGLLGAVVPSSLRGLDFTLVGLFAVLTVDALRSERDISTALLALMCAITALAVASSEMLVVAMTLFVALLIARSRMTPTPEAVRA